MRFSIVLTLFLTVQAIADDGHSLKPLMAVADAIVLQNDFEKSTILKKAEWLQRQGTRWAIEDGVLRGRPSSKEYQESKPHHKGYEPRTSVPVTPPEFIAKFSVRFLAGTETAIVPFVEFGHHVCRVRFSEKVGLELLAAGETLRLGKAANYKFEAGKWYHIVAEMKAGEFVIQFEDGPTLYAQHETFETAPKSGGNGLGIAGLRDGLVEIDNLTIWSVQDRPKSSWESTRAQMQKFEPQLTEKAKKAKKKK